jgi:hypothetical protein
MGADGTVRAATPAGPGKLEKLAADLSSRPIQLSTPTGNGVSLVGKFLVHCSTSEECTFLFRPPVEVWREEHDASTGR